MGDVGDFWRDVSAARKEKRAENRESSPGILTKHEVQFASKNAGAHLIVSHGKFIVDFWPGTGKWIFRGGSKKGRGVYNLLRHLEVEIRQ
jgi:hypothetical protein